MVTAPSAELEEAVARTLYPRMVFGGDYEDVPIDEAFRRPRYLHLRQRAIDAARAVIAEHIAPVLARALAAERALAEALKKLHSIKEPHQ